MTEGIPVDILEKRAAEQRLEIHDRARALRGALREKLDVKRNVRNHLGPVAGGVALVGLVLGYTLTGIFKHD